MVFSMLVLVAGMHRSGTSAVAELLMSLGCSAGPAENLIGATKANPHGHFESLPMVQMNDQLLAEVGAHWLYPADAADRFKALATTAWRSKAVDALEATGWSRGSAPPFVVKDPRFCLTIPFWADVLADATDVRVIVVYRDANEVAASLNERDGLSVGYGRYLWHEYNRLLVRNVAAMNVEVVSYADVLDDPSGTAKALATAIDGLVAGATAAPIDASLRHHRELSTDGFGARLLRSFRELANGSMPSDPIAPAVPSTDDAMSALAKAAADLHRIGAERDAARDAYDSLRSLATVRGLWHAGSSRLSDLAVRRGSGPNATA